jgi:hypothetical protein
MPSHNDQASMLADISREISEDRFSPNDFESKFLENVGELIRFEIELSGPQDEKLEEIWKKALEG